MRGRGESEWVDWSAYRELTEADVAMLNHALSAGPERIDYSEFYEEPECEITRGEDGVLWLTVNVEIGPVAVPDETGP